MKLKSLALAVALSLSGVSHAAMTSSSVDESVAGVYSTTYFFSDQATDASASEFALHLFDASKGTLKSVDLTLEGTVAAGLRVTNRNADAKSFSNLQASAPISLKLNWGGVTLAGTAATSTKVATYTLAGNSSADLKGASVAISTSTQFAQPLDLSSFQGVGDQYSTALFMVTAGRTSVTGNMILNTSYGFLGSGNGSLKVSYAYEPVSAVPVPASAWLLGSGVLSMGFFMRRRRGAATQTS
jgi:hypothetical protein